MMEPEEKIQILRSALIGLVGVSSTQELEVMEVQLRLMPLPDVDKAATINAVRALIETNNEEEEDPHAKT